LIAPFAEAISKTGIREGLVQMIHKKGQVAARRGVYDLLQNREDWKRKRLWFSVQTFALGERQHAIADVLSPKSYRVPASLPEEH
jgi:hypothetical protein